jgi:hypothetical protein
MEKADGHQTSEKAYNDSQNYQTPVMLAAETA